MARKIELEFYDKKYIIEYNRKAVADVVRFKGKDDIDVVVNLIKCGLSKNHEKDMPSDDEIIGWVMALGDDLTAFAEALKELVQDVLNTFENDRKNYIEISSRTRPG